MRRLPVALVTLLSLVIAASPAAGQAVVLKFDEIPGAATGPSIPVGSFYAGGGGAAFDYGIEFATPAQTVCLNRPGVRCSNASWGADPAAAARGTEKAAVFFGGGTPIINRAAGFTGAFSFAYADPFVGGGTAEVWSGLDATGTRLGFVSFPSVGNGRLDPTCFASDFCPFATVSVSFTGVARSVRFGGGTATGGAFDDLTFGVGPTAVVPEPTSAALLGGGLLLVGGVLRRRRAASPLATPRAPW